VTDSVNPRSQDSRASLALLIFIIAAHIAYFLPQSSSITEVTQSYPSTACPGSIGDAKATALLPSKSIEVRDVARPQSLQKKKRLGLIFFESRGHLGGGECCKYRCPSVSSWKVDGCDDLHSE